MKYIESICDEQVRLAMEYELGRQSQDSHVTVHSIETEVKRVRRVLTKYFDPYQEMHITYGGNDG